MAISVVVYSGGSRISPKGGPKETFDFHRNTVVGVMVGTKRVEEFPGAERG